MLNQWALSGDWTIESGVSVLNGNEGRIASRFHARDVHLVMGPAKPGASVPFRLLSTADLPAARTGSKSTSRATGHCRNNGSTR